MSRVSYELDLLHALGAVASELLIGMGLGQGEQLFGGERGDSQEGFAQGFPLTALLFCLAIHPELCDLDAELRPFGGCARAIMDDVYAVGPASVVFPAIQRFAAALRTMVDVRR